MFHYRAGFTYFELILAKHGTFRQSQWTATATIRSKGSNVSRHPRIKWVLSRALQCPGVYHYLATFCCVVVFYLQSRSTATSNGVVFMQKWTLQLCLPTCCRMCLNLWRRVLLSMPGSLSMQARHGKYRYSRYLFGKFRQSDVFKVHFLNRVEGHKI